MAEDATAAERRHKGRRRKRRQEFDEQERLAAALARHLDPAVFWCSIENRPRTRLAGRCGRRRGIKAGLPDLLIIANGRPIFLELKNACGVSTPQLQIRAQLLAANATWLMARSVRAALLGLHRSGVAFRKNFKPPQVVEPWEGPTTAERLPPSPELVGERREAVRRWRARQRARALEAATEPEDGAGPASYTGGWAASETAPGS